MTRPEEPSESPPRSAVTFGGPRNVISLRPEVPGIFVPRAEWDLLSARVKRCGAETELFFPLAWGLLGIAVTALVAASSLTPPASSTVRIEWWTLGVSTLGVSLVTFAFWALRRRDNFRWVSVATEDMLNIERRHTDAGSASGSDAPEPRDDDRASTLKDRS